MAKQANAAVERPNLVARVKEFYREVRTEMEKVSWPSWEEVKGSTQIVLFLLVVMAALVFVYDQVFGKLIILLLTLP